LPSAEKSRPAVFSRHDREGSGRHEAVSEVNFSVGGSAKRVRE
jgi:hypothetical protein